MGAPHRRPRIRRKVAAGKAAAWLVLLVVVSAGAPAHSARAAEPSVILISMDGTRPADLAIGGLPALERIVREGAHAERLIPVYPANTFPNHVSLVTGVSPERHGIVNNVFVDAARGRYSYDPDPTWLEAEPLWSIVEGHGLISASYYWVGSEGAWRNGRGPRHWKPFSSRTGEAEKVDQILAWLGLPEDERPRLITAWFHGADGSAHRHGPGADEVAESLRAQDRELGRLLAALDAGGHFANTTLLVVSDHGMHAVESKVILQAVFDEAGIEAEVQGGGGFATVTLGNAGARSAALAAARGEGLEAWVRGAGPPGYESRHPHFGDIVVMAPPGVMIARDGAYGRVRAAFTNGGHGYRPEEPSMAAVFLALGRAAAPGARLGEVRALDVAPTVLTLLGLPVPETMEGRPIRLAAPARPAEQEGTRE